MTEEAERRDALVFQLYLAGMPYRQIAARPKSGCRLVACS